MKGDGFHQNGFQIDGLAIVPAHIEFASHEVVIGGSVFCFRGFVQLFNIAKDVGEDNDLKDVEPGITKALLDRLTQWQAGLPKKPAGNVFSKLRGSKNKN